MVLLCLEYKSISQQYFMIDLEKRNRPKALLKDIVCNRDEELLEKYYEHAC
jgi:hypothetical protein